MDVTIKTPQRAFVTNPKQWLGQSLYFKNLFSGQWGDKQEDGSYFIETDADIFQHILTYLRTGVLPVFYDNTTGHDFPLYQALLAESIYFAIERLEKWLCEQTYLQTVKIHHFATETDGLAACNRSSTTKPEGHTLTVEDGFIEMPVTGNIETTIFPVVIQTNVFYCPSGMHGRSVGRYCNSCIDQARDKGVSIFGGWRKEDQLRWCIVQKEVDYDHDLCANAFLSD